MSPNGFFVKLLEFPRVMSRMGFSLNFWNFLEWCRPWYTTRSIATCGVVLKGVTYQWRKSCTRVKEIVKKRKMPILMKARCSQGSRTTNQNSSKEKLLWKRKNRKRRENFIKQDEDNLCPANGNAQRKRSPSHARVSTQEAGLRAGDGIGRSQRSTWGTWFQSQRRRDHVGTCSQRGSRVSC